MSAKRPSINAMDTAAQWLDVNDGERGEGDECHAVAKWLREQIAAAELRAAAKQAGVPTAAVRRAMRRVSNR